MEFNDYYHQSLRSKLSELSASINQSTEFTEQITQAIQIRKNSIELIKNELRRKVSQTPDVESILKYCDTIIKSNIVLAVVGRLNAGKSMLVSQLLNRQIELPSSDEATTGRITRIVYNKVPILRIIRTGKWNKEESWNTDISINCDSYKESVLNEFPLNEENMNRYIQLSGKEKNNVQSLSTIIEIGIPSNLLGLNKVTILDCPGLDENTLLSHIELKILSKLHPSIICYVYDHNQGFNMTDGQRLKEMIEKLQPVETVIVANNKCDAATNKFDTKEESRFDQVEADATIRQNTPWKHSLSSPFVDKDRMLPVLPLSIGELIFEEERDNSVLMFHTLQEQIASRIIAQSRSILHELAHRVHHRSNFQLYLLLKSLSVEDELFELISSTNIDYEFRVEFTKQYQIIGIDYRDDQIHITSGSSCSSEFALQHEKYHHDVNPNYETPLILFNKSVIYLIEKERYKKRLIDHLEDYSLDNMIDFLKQTAEMISNNNNCSTNFRPDNVYIDDNKLTICFDVGIPNKCNVQFILKDNKKVKPFHLHLPLKIIDNFEMDFKERLRIQNVHSFAAMVWILIDGRGTNSFDSTAQDLKQNLIGRLKNDCQRFPNYPTYLNIVMKQCFKHFIDRGLVHMNELLSRKSGIHELNYYIDKIFDFDVTIDLKSIDSLLPLYDEKCVQLDKSMRHFHRIITTEFTSDSDEVTESHFRFLCYCFGYKLADIKDDFTLLSDYTLLSDETDAKVVDLTDPNANSFFCSFFENHCTNNIQGAASQLFIVKELNRINSKLNNIENVLHDVEKRFLVNEVDGDDYFLRSEFEELKTMIDELLPGLVNGHS